VPTVPANGQQVVSLLDGQSVQDADFGNAPPGPALPGDYNENGIVGAADYIRWRKMLGTSGVPAYSGADGDGDTEIGPGDYGVWTAHFGETVGAGSGAGEELGAGSGEGASSEQRGASAGVARPESATGVVAAPTSNTSFAEPQDVPHGRLRIADFGLRIEEGRGSRVKSQEPAQVTASEWRWRDGALAAWLASRSVGVVADADEEFGDGREDDPSIETGLEFDDDAWDAMFASLESYAGSAKMIV
jgi:hypothetical protein